MEQRREISHGVLPLTPVSEIEYLFMGFELGAVRGEIPAYEAESVLVQLGLEEVFALAAKEGDVIIDKFSSVLEQVVNKISRGRLPAFKPTGTNFFRELYAYVSKYRSVFSFQDVFYPGVTMASPTREEELESEIWRVVVRICKIALKVFFREEGLMRWRTVE